MSYETEARILKGLVGERTISFYPAFARLVGTANAGLLLSQAIFHTCTEGNRPERTGWFYKTQNEWAEVTCLTRWEQETARRLLRHFDFWNENPQAALPPNFGFGVDMERLYAALSQYVEKPHPRLLVTDMPVGGKTSDKKVEKPQSLKGTEITSETTQRENVSATRSTELLDEILFSTWWESYPRKIDKPNCQRLWISLSVLDRAAAFEGLEVWSKSVEWQDRKFIPHPATFLKRRQWEDRPVKASGKGAINADERTRRNLAVAGL